ncbi:MAG: DNA/RNA non-specific endonuclease [Nitrosarchaeum sp.]|nr:DNA/RNA non-specific endonuclease [Nitrosarchaeum sp.]
MVRKDKKQKSPQPKKKSSPLMPKLKKFVRTCGAEYLKDPNITSIGIGYKLKDGIPSNELAIQFTVDSKAVPEDLARLDTKLIPESIEIDGVKIPTDVIQRKFTAEFHIVEETPSNERKTRQNPLMPGISVAHVKGSAGTIGCIVNDKDSGIPFILSNWHVLHTPKGEIGDLIVQPGPYDNNQVDLNKMGKLVRSHLGHAGDCAVATIEDRDIKAKILGLDITLSKLGEPEIGDKVMKSGRTTKVTHGIVSRVNVISKIPYGGTIGEQEVGGFEIQVDPDNEPENGEISMGGDSGSVWVFKNSNGNPTEVMAGLHFAGESSTNPTEFALACYPKSVFEKLNIALSSKAELEKIRKYGFSTDFLSKKISLPKLSATNKKNAYFENENEVIDYTHFSLALNKIRKFAFWVAWNIDGGSIRRLSRKGLKFELDSQIPDEYQVGNELYENNRLDRGHIARRADLVWGSLEEAKKANKDSFYYTNIAPQMDNYNQSRMNGIWGRLENAVFDDTEVENLKVSLFGGPVFHENDIEYRGIKLPHEFWKVIIFTENSKLKAKGFMLTQNLDQLEVLELDEFKVYQVALSEIEQRCGLSFSKTLKEADSLGEPSQTHESLSKRKAVESLQDIDWS